MYNQQPTIPRQLFLYWHQGWEDAPDIVKRCAATWQHHNPSWDISLLDATSIADKIELPSELQTLQLPLAGRADVIRISLLRRYGGVWADATTWCMRSLDDWIESVCHNSGFFAYDKPSPHRPISNWFLAASRNSRIIELWHSETQYLLMKTLAYMRYHKLFRLCMKSYLQRRFKHGRLLIMTSQGPRAGEYFWLHFLFRNLLDESDEFRQLWAATPRISADGPHLLQQTGLLKPATEQTDSAIKNRLSNVFKLTHRKAIPENIDGTVLGTLYHTSNTP